MIEAENIKERHKMELNVKKEEANTDIFKDLAKKNKTNGSKYNEAMKLAYDGKYDEAIKMLKPLSEKGNLDARNNMGVCYERKHDYDKAISLYLGTDLLPAKVNALHLYRRNKVAFSLQNYLDCCKYLIQKENQFGFAFLSMLYEDNSRGLEDGKRAFEIIMEGLKCCNKYDELTFRAGYLFEAGIGCHVDHHRSHMLYSTILDNDNQVTAKYNYALQCFYGRGCEKNINRAKKYFELAAKKGYKDAIKYLEIIREEESKKNKKSQEVK